MHFSMKTKAIYKVLLAACLMLAFVSCTKDQEDVFDQPAAARLKDAMVNAKDVLTSASNGWVMYYYPEGDQIYGGFVHVMKFTDDGSVTIWSELFDDSYTSHYSMRPDDGPVLSFDTNNFAFHYFATPSGSTRNKYGESGRYQAYKGDFEFMVMKADANEVIINGKRTRNKIHMYPLVDETPEQFMDKLWAFEDNLVFSSFTGTIGIDAAEVYLSLGNRQASITLPEKKDANDEPLSADMAYSVTKTGILFYKPVEIGSYTLSELTLDLTSQSLVAENPNVSLKGQLPEGWHSYADFLGTYTLTYNDGAATIAGVQIKEDVAGKSYIVSGLSDAFDVAATYDLGLGRLEIQAQYVAGPELTGNDYYVMMAVWDSDAGRVQYSNGGVYGILDEEGNKITWTDNGNFSGYTVDGFILYYFTSSGTRVGATPAPWAWSGRTSGVNQAWGWVSMDRS